MTDWSFTWRNTPLVACASGALWWPADRLLCIADLHLGRAERLARRGGSLLPPYETCETLNRLEREIERRGARTIVCLGDSFDDTSCEPGLGSAERDRLLAMMAGRDWIWIAGNHDPGPVSLGGRHLAAYALGGLSFRHAPERDAPPGEVVGHLHPKASVSITGRSVCRPSFVYDAHRLILPAFGAYTGGLSVEVIALTGWVAADRCMTVLTGKAAIALPLRAPRMSRARMRGPAVEAAS